MKFENTEVWGFNHALRGMRNPMNSWDKSDSGYKIDHSSIPGVERFVIGKNDLELAQKLIKAGSEHRKFFRQIFVSVDITAPLYWWKEFDTYKVGTVSNSCSTMHTLIKNPITEDCFEMDDFEDILVIQSKENETYFVMHGIWHNIIVYCECLRKEYVETKDKMIWKELIRLLPESYLQKRTITMNYENILSMVKQRRNHKLIEWSVAFILWAKSLPYADKLIFIGEEDGKC